MQYKKNILIIGAGAAGLEATYQLSKLGLSPIVIEKDNKLGGNLNNWDRLFPNMESSDDIVQELIKKVKGQVNIKIFTSTQITQINKLTDDYSITLSSGENIIAQAILISTGFELFKAGKKEEYGYGIYDNVITNADLEKYFKTNIDKRINNPKTIGFVHCVGSRDEKAGNRHCSKVCCITAIKQACELKELYPDATIYCFYMDLRMFGRHFEDIYLDAQQKYGIRFIRGRVSEVAENNLNQLIIKAEDTLAGRPIKVSLDLLVLMSGMVNHSSSTNIIKQLSMSLDEDGFIRQNSSILSSLNNTDGVFMAGACTGPKTLPETLYEANTVALLIFNYLNKTN